MPFCHERSFRHRAKQAQKQHTKLLTVLGEGDFFGEVSLLTGEPSSATVRSAEYSSLMVLLPAVFNDFVQRFPILRDEMSRCKQQQQQRYGINLLERRRGYGRKAGAEPSLSVSVLPMSFMSS